mmetsp:Transcript_34601/g.52942  ORF Transcript_34601/g.52942 Transcript_34601/m.52942 type:complete len:83 (+) Transcript_34601:321-569(+)|eukprot:CAMPEP_0170501978 /NCGR_PEP_ID=MMETSP0208-20121228/40105_1 /TAXON_ID=197538 /ORGANISM="Strombidium inclinatum, Strain S3" /LENGTH=82 /DNA_ID=CAMNT_0010780821 /DNA_START=206 /DNA_END=454 /DNA_ORIENTATION=-
MSENSQAYRDFKVRMGETKSRPSPLPAIGHPQMGLSQHSNMSGQNSQPHSAAMHPSAQLSGKKPHLLQHQKKHESVELINKS